MERIADLAVSKRLLKQLHTQPKAGYSQNFLIDTAIIDKIVAVSGYAPALPALEIGPGLGALTQALLLAGAQLTAVELDSLLAAHLRRYFAAEPALRIIEADALQLDYPALAAANGWRQYHLFANLPYQITSALLQKLLLAGGPWSCLTLLMQQEVAEKLLLRRGKENGPLPLLLDDLAEGEYLFEIPASAFYPAPKVVSALINLRRRSQPKVAPDLQEVLFRLIESGFRQRRKTLLNNLAADQPPELRPLLQQALLAAGLPEQVRAEQLQLEDFAHLSRLLLAKNFFKI